MLREKKIEKRNRIRLVIVWGLRVESRITLFPDLRSHMERSYSKVVMMNDIKMNVLRKRAR